MPLRQATLLTIKVKPRSKGSDTKVSHVLNNFFTFVIQTRSEQSSSLLTRAMKHL
ncbi:hypothetical protein NGB25_12800 [Staphylococcus saprophyticus]|uniref:hypothetical protein n=1 Tax=Staphylococcus saprophyticus TaxID=29385 RepID=UPI002DB82343|nr:hypothetical protein [Staphylococcus saprophyticus]MEB7677974.1 hypothetical protein [Staphylococcus saprophyticus]MEB7677979.1 hypothetical protein [Staphylococcus saprophyticus]